MMRVKLTFSFDGSNYFGSQKQLNKITIQSVLENALKSIYKTDVSLVFSGRTDSGVSAICQVAHFDCEKIIGKLTGRLNSVLPKDIRIISDEVVDDNFHARFNAKQKTYQYNFYISNTPIPYYDRFALRINENVNIDKMMMECNSFLGEHDFTSFSGKTEVENKVRNISQCGINNCGYGLYSFMVTGNGFLYNMVRIMVGTLIDIGGGIIKYGVKDILNSLDRTRAGKTVSAVGLVLLGIKYE